MCTPTYLRQIECKKKIAVNHIIPASKFKQLNTIVHKLLTILKCSQNKLKKQEKNEAIKI